MPDAEDGVRGEKGRSSPRVVSQGIDCRGSCYEASVRPASWSQDGAGGRRRSSPRADTSVGEAARREATSLLLSRRRARGEAAGRLCVSHAAGMWNRSGRQTHSDRLLRTKRKARSVPGVQRMKRSTPTARPVPSERRTNVKPQPQDQCPTGEGPTSNFNRQTGVRGVKDQRQTSTAGLGRGRRTNVNSVDSARAACERPTSNSAVAAFPRGRR